MSCKYCRHERMKRRRRPPTAMRPLTGDQAASLMASFRDDNVDQELKVAVTLVLNTGMRLGELRNLRWSDVDMQARTITIHGAVMRRIPYNAVVAAMLDQRREVSDSSEWMFKGAPQGALLLAPARLKELGMSVLGRVVAFRELRHTYFAMLAVRGVDLATMMFLGGWRSPLMPLRFMRPEIPAQVLAMRQTVQE